MHLRGTRTLPFRHNPSSATALNTSATGDPQQSRTNRALSNGGTEKGRIHYFTGQLTSLWRPAWTNELRVTANREERPRLNNAAAPLIQSAIGRFDARNFPPTTEQDSRVQIDDAVSVRSGSHTVKLGVDYSRLTASQSSADHGYKT